MPIVNLPESVKTTANQLNVECQAFINHSHGSMEVAQEPYSDYNTMNYRNNNALFLINEQLNLLARHVGLDLFFSDKIEKFLYNIHHTDNLISSLAFTYYDNLFNYLSGINRLLKTHHLNACRYVVVKLLDKLEQPIIAVYDYITVVYMELQSACVGSIYRSITQIRGELIHTMITSHVETEHVPQAISSYLASYQSWLNDTQWETDILNESKPVNLDLIDIPRVSKLKLMEKLNKEARLGNYIKSLAEKIHHNITCTFTQEAKGLPDINVVSRERYNKSILMLQKIYPFIEFNDLITLRYSTAEYIIKEPEYLFKTLSEKLSFHDLSKTHYTIHTLFDTNTHSIRSIDGLYWAEDKAKQSVLPLTLSVFVQARITGCLDKDMLLYAIHNSPAPMICELFDPRWVMDYEHLVYEISSPKILLVAYFLVKNRFIPLNKQYKNGRTLFMSAILNRDCSLVSDLLQHADLNINIHDENGFTALMFAIQNNLPQTVLQLSKRPEISMNSQNNIITTPLIMAVKTGDVFYVNTLSSHPDTDINQTDKEGDTALIHSVRLGKMLILRNIINAKNIDINKRNHLGLSPLQTAAMSSKRVCSFLLSLKKIAINSNNGHSTPLIIAVAANKLSVISLFLKNKRINVNLCNKNGITALHIAVYKGLTKAVKLLLQHRDTNVNAADNNILTALMLAIYRDHRRIVEMLLNHPALNVNCKDNHMMTPLMLSVMNDNIIIVKKLLEHPSLNINDKNSRGETALFLAIRKGAKKLVDILAAHKDNDINTADHKGNTALHIAVMEESSYEIICLLIKNKIDIYRRNHRGLTALCIATEQGYTSITILLSQAG